MSYSCGPPIWEPFRMPRDLHHVGIGRYRHGLAMTHGEQRLLQGPTTKPMTHEAARDAEELVVPLAGRYRCLVPHGRVRRRPWAERAQVLRQEIHESLTLAERAHGLQGM